MVHPLFLNLGSGEIFIIVLVIIIFFGANKLPEMVRTFSRGMKEMKNATSELQREIQNSATEIQREMNASGAIDNLKDVANDVSNRIAEGAKTDEDEVPPKPDDDSDNPLNPDNSYKREI